MPRASVRIASDANPLSLRSPRSAKRISRVRVSRNGKLRCSRYDSLVCSTPPNSRCAAARASGSLMPRRMFSSVRSWRCSLSSVSRSRRKARRLLKLPTNRDTKRRSVYISCSLRPEQPLDDRGHTFPGFGFGRELSPAGARQRVKLCFAIVFGDAPFRRNPAALFKAQKRGVKRALIQLEQILRDLLDAHGDSVAVLRAHRVERFEDDQIQRALQNFSRRWRHRLTLL